LILVTGASGKTGRALLGQLVRLGQPVRALVRRQAQMAPLMELGVQEVIAADLLDADSLIPAFTGVSVVYHIPPNVHPQEELIAEYVMRLAELNAVRHFIYHSVLRPYIRAMPHHIKKARVEERLFISGLPFTILQPAAYMQNTIPGLQTARKDGVFSVPYPIDTPMSLVDLEEVAEVGARVVNNAGHFGATYELVGSEILTPADVAECMGAALGKPVEARQEDLKTWRRAAGRAGMARYQVDTLIKMFRYYAEHGFWGNPHNLSSLLGRPPKTYAQFLAGLDLPRL
jgi:uncharacterized protein YbjT (DUF2867 family)